MWLASFPGSTQLSVACSTETASGRSLGTRLATCSSRFITIQWHIFIYITNLRPFTLILTVQLSMLVKSYYTNVHKRHVSTLQQIGRIHTQTQSFEHTNFELLQLVYAMWYVFKLTSLCFSAPEVNLHTSIWDAGSTNVCRTIVGRIWANSKWSKLLRKWHVNTLPRAKVEPIWALLYIQKMKYVCV